jgi:phage baseplate assembly protein W
MNPDFPFHFDARGHSATTSYEDYVRGLVEQVLFTSPGERVNRPDFGAGLGQLVFAPNGVELAGATQLLVQSSLQQSLGTVITVESVEVDSDQSLLQVRVQYIVRRTSTRQVNTFSLGRNA